MHIRFVAGRSFPHCASYPFTSHPRLLPPKSLSTVAAVESQLNCRWCHRCFHRCERLVLRCRRLFAGKQPSKKSQTSLGYTPGRSIIYLCDAHDQLDLPMRRTCTVMTEYVFVGPEVVDVLLWEDTLQQDLSDGSGCHGLAMWTCVQ